MSFPPALGLQRPLLSSSHSGPLYLAAASSQTSAPLDQVALIPLLSSVLVAKRRLEELKQHQEKRRQESLRSRQIAQRLGVEEAHMVEFQQFNAAWDEKMKEYEERATELLEAMRQRHMLDYNEFRRKTELEPQRKPKFSKELLDLRKIEVTLAKRGEYADAQKVKVQADEMEAQVQQQMTLHATQASSSANLTVPPPQELDKMQALNIQHLSNLEAKFLHKQDQELSALRQRIQAGSEEQRKARQMDLERLLQRYHNVKAELESQQVAERLRMKKGISGLESSYMHSRMNASRLSSRGPRS